MRKEDCPVSLVDKELVKTVIHLLEKAELTKGHDSLQRLEEKIVYLTRVISVYKKLINFVNQELQPFLALFDVPADQYQDFLELFEKRLLS